MPDDDADHSNRYAGLARRVVVVASLDAREPSLIIAATIFQLAILAWMILGRTL